MLLLDEDGIADELHNAVTSNTKLFMQTSPEMGVQIVSMNDVIMLTKCHSVFLRDLYEKNN